MKHIGLLCFVVLAGCGSMAIDTGAGGPPAPTEDAPGINILAIEPNYGTTAGGTMVFIEGERFPVEPLVYVNDVEVEPVAITGNQIQVQMPMSSEEGWVEIRIEGDGDSDKKRKGFQYFTDGLGEAGMWGEISRRDYLGGYWTSPYGAPAPYTLPSTAVARFAMVRPTPVSWLDLFGGTLDACQIDLANFNLSTVATEAEEMVLSSLYDNLTLVPSSTSFNFMETVDLEPSLLQGGTTWSLEPSNRADEWPGFGLESLATTPSRPAVQSPDMDQDFLSTTNPGMIFQWTSDEPADFIVILAQLAGDYGGTPLELVSCVVRDDGSFAIPADIWTQWADGDVVIVEFGRLDVSDRTLPHNRANAEFAAISWQIGALLTN